MRYPIFPAILALSLLFGQVNCRTIRAESGHPAESSAAANVDLERQLLDRTRSLLRLLQQSDARVIGSLKFMARHEGSKNFNDSLGRLHQRLAEKVEMAMVFAGGPESGSKGNPSNPVVIQAASATAASIPGANHLNPKDDIALDRLFEREYPLAWKHEGKERGHPDAFIFGVAQLSDDLRTIDIQLNAVLRKGLSFDQQGTRRFTDESFQAPLDLDDLLSAGEGYCVEATDGSDGIGSKDEAFRNAKAGKDQPRAHPLLDPKRPVEIEIWYDQEKKDIAFFENSEDRCSGAYLPEPKEHQRVRIAVRRTNPKDTQRYGILLRVNGKNTLGKESLPDQRCSLWILQPDKQSMVVDGFQTSTGSEGTREPFRVASRDESKQLETLYGTDVGLISIAVYREALSPTKEVDEDAVEHKYAQLYAVKKLTLPDRPAESRSRLGQNLTDQLYRQFEKGVISNDATALKVPTREVAFQRQSHPFFAASIRYYKPSKK